MKLFSQTPSHAAVKPLNSAGYTTSTGRDNDEFNICVGKAIDTLRTELPVYFQQGLVNYDIYHDQITLTEPYNHKFYLKGKWIYRQFMEKTRRVFQWYFSDLQLDLKSFHRPVDNELHIRWILQGTAKPSLIKSWISQQFSPSSVSASDSQMVEQTVYEGLFIYRFNRQGKIIEHHVTDIIPAPRRFAPLQAIGWFQRRRGRFTIPELTSSSSSSTQS